jgi:hypothetical protein
VKEILNIIARTAGETAGDALFPKKNAGGRRFYARLTPDESA